MIHPLLERQLRGLGLDAETPPDADAWAEVLRRVTRAYEGSDRGRYLMERSLEISSAEMRELYEQLRASSESELARERDYAATLVGSMQDGLTVLSPSAVLTEVSPSFCAMTGFSREELIGTGPPYPYWPRSDRAAIERGFARIRDEGSAEWDLTFRRRDGTTLSVILAGSLLRGEGDRIAGYLATVKDVTARKRAEVRLAASGARNRRLAAEQAALRRVATVVAREAEPGRAFALIAEEVADLLGVECGLVARYEDDRAVPVGWCGAHQEDLRLAFPLEGEGALARVRRSGRPARVTAHLALDADPVGRIALAARYRSGVAAPVSVGGRIWGAVLAATTLDEPIETGAEARLVMFAELAALAIANADARAEIGAEKERLRSVLETAHDGWVALDDTGRITGWNPRSEEIFGWSADDVMGRSLAEVAVPAARRTAYERVLARLLAHGPQAELQRPVELIARRRDGREVPVEVTVSAVPFGGTVALHAFVRDIGDRRRAERREAAQHAVARALAESASEEEVRPRLLRALGEGLGWREGAFWSVDAARDLLTCDARWGKGGPPDRIGAERAWRAGEPVLSPALGGETALAMPIASDGTVLAVLQLRGPGIGLGERDLLSTMTAVCALVGQYVGRKRVARETERLKDEFFALVSHELRTPLTSIIGYLELVLEDEEELGPTSAPLPRGDRAQRRAACCAWSATCSSSPRSRPASSRSTRRGRSTCAALAASRVQAAPPARRARAASRWRSRPARRQPAGRPRPAGQVLDNLVSNALKFTPAGGRVDVRLRGDGDSASIEVADTGIGIPAAEQERLFQRFFRASTATRDRSPASASGLTSPKAIVEAHGGTIEVESEEGMGAIFRVRLPLGEPPRSLPVAAAVTARPLTVR